MAGPSFRMWPKSELQAPAFIPKSYNLSGIAADRMMDVPSDEELSTCLAAMSSGKAPGHDGAPVDWPWELRPTFLQDQFACHETITEANSKRRQRKPLLIRGYVRALLS